MSGCKVLIAMQAVHKSKVLSKMTSEALGSIKCSHRWSAQVDDRDVNLATKWNTALDMACNWGMDYLILVNNDVLFDDKCLDNLIRFKMNNPEYLVAGPTQYFEGQLPEYSDATDSKLHWSFVILDPIEVLKKIGYCETRLNRGSFVDTEWQIRIEKIGEKVSRTLNSWFFHYNDTTHRLLPEYKDSFAANHAIVREKWGHDYEFDHPYDNPSLSIKYFGAKNGD